MQKLNIEQMYHSIILWPQQTKTQAKNYTLGQLDVLITPHH